MTASSDSSAESLGLGLAPGQRHYRAFVGLPERYDLVGAMQFNLLTALGLREHHFLLDIGCGSLRAGRLFIPFLQAGHYFGIEPEKWLVEEGIDKQVGADLIRLKQPSFHYDSNFPLTAFDRKFDFVVAQSIFSHTSASQIRQCLGEARKVLTPSSIFAATFVEGEEDYSGDEWVYPDCVSYTFEFFSRLVEQAGLSCRRLDWGHPNGQKWVAITLPDAQPLPVIADPASCGSLRAELEYCRQQLKKTVSHPYVQLGLGVRKILKRMGISSGSNQDG